MEAFKLIMYYLGRILRFIFIWFILLPIMIIVETAKKQK